MKRGRARLFRAIAYKQAVLLVRYPVNTASQLATVYFAFLVIFFGGRALVGPTIDDSLDGIIVGFFLWTLAIVAYSGLSWDLTREAQWGTLEQLFMSPFGFGTVMAFKVGVNVLFSLGWGAVILVLMLATTGRTLHLPLVTVVVLGLLAVASAAGVGFAFGGLALVYKRVENAFQLVQFAFIGLIAAPVGEYPWLRFLPLAQGSQLLGRAMTTGVRLWELPTGDLGVLVLTAVGYLGVGFYLFMRAQRRARRLGVLGHY